VDVARRHESGDASPERTQETRSRPRAHPCSAPASAQGELQRAPETAIYGASEACGRHHRPHGRQDGPRHLPSTAVVVTSERRFDVANHDRGGRTAGDGAGASHALPRGLEPAAVRVRRQPALTLHDHFRAIATGTPRGRHRCDARPRAHPEPTALELPRRPQQRGQDHLGQADGQPDDPAGDVLAHEHRAQERQSSRYGWSPSSR
jgi:hypothetical protein